MSDHAGYCPCPVLRAAAEIERLAQMGLRFDGHDPTRHIVVAALRERYGCRGPRDRNSGWLCPWEHALPYGRQLALPRDVPEISGKSGTTGQYL